MIFVHGHAPNKLQNVDLAWIEPNEENVRLFVERVSLQELVRIYTIRAKELANPLSPAVQGNAVILPDAPVVRYKGYRADGTPRLVLLAGERRTTAAKLAGLESLQVRIVTLSDEDAYRFILRHNNVAGLTTLELAFRAAEMDRLGFDHDEISKELGGVAVHRYLSVGRMVDSDLFTDGEKLCNPSIVEWYEASQFGKKHFNRCFALWNAGELDDKEAAKLFRKRGKALPIDNAEKGFRVTFDGSRLVIRGQCDLEIADEDTAYDMLVALENAVHEAQYKLDKGEDFGDRHVLLINPTTVEQ